MMSYLIINGKKSTDVNGLLIQKLPPITKPLMRTMIEQIDGRAGDIITDLGFNSYDKKVLIGLHGNYNVNEVIAFFNSQGVVTFSDEPDKYYYFKIYQKIDFERLIRFRKATVTFHIQPFKYSLVDRPISKTITPLITFSDFTVTQNGLTVVGNDGVITFTGTPTQATQIEIPINEVTISGGLFTLLGTAKGLNCGACDMRLIKDNTSASQSFGATSVTLKNNDTVTISSDIAFIKTFKKLVFYVIPMQVDFTLEVNLSDGYRPNIEIVNEGNIYSKPTVTLYGKGLVELYLNDKKILDINLSDPITIDAEKMEAFKTNTMVLMNRNVYGNYDDLKLETGKNIISWIGDVSRITVDKYSRWL